MFFNQDIRKFGKLDRSLTEPLRQELKNYDFLAVDFNRKEPPLMGGRIVEFPFIVQVYPDSRKETLRLLETAQPILDYVKQQFPNHVFVRGEISVMFGKTKLDTHLDMKWFHANCHRMHVPIVTNPRCTHIFEGRSYHFDEDELLEINNRIWHSAINDGEETRTHVIFDIIPQDKFDLAMKNSVDLNRREEIKK